METGPPCPFCGGSSFTWGVLQSQGIRFVPDEVGWLGRTFGMGSDMRARRCDGCRNVQLFDVEDQADSGYEA